MFYDKENCYHLFDYITLVKLVNTLFLMHVRGFAHCAPHFILKIIIGFFIHYNLQILFCSFVNSQFWCHELYYIMFITGSNTSGVHLFG